MGNGFDNTVGNQQATSSTVDYWSKFASESQQSQKQGTSRAPWQPDVIGAQDTIQAAPADKIQTAPADTTVHDPIKLFSDASTNLSKEGMTPATKQSYVKAIAAADEIFSPQDRSMVQALSDVIASGKKTDGTAISATERFGAHQLVNEELKAASLGVQMRLVYANLLVETKQYASAEKVFKDSIKAADQLPQDLIKKESQQLQNDMKSVAISRDQQVQMMEYAKDISGDQTVKRPGFGYLPSLSRLQAAAFYVSAEPRGDNHQLGGVLKPQLALGMLNEARTVYQHSFNVDLSKTPNADPLYAFLSQKANLMLPENLRKAKSNADGFWSNALIDGGVGAAVVGIAGVTLAAVSKNPALINLGLTTAEGSLTLGGKAAAAGIMLGTATVGRHYTKELITGSSEGWQASTIHGAAGLAAIGLIAGAQAKTSQFFFRGADSDTALLRIAQEKGTEGVLRWGTVKEIFTANNWAIPAKLASVDASTVLVQNGALVNSIDLGLDAAKSATLAKAAIGIPAQGALARGAKFFSEFPSNLVENAKGIANFKALDLMTATPQQIAWRANWSGYLSALSGIEGYRAITSLDRKYDVVNGGQIGLAESLKENMLTPDPLWDSLVMMPFLRAGVMPKNLYAENAGPISRGWGTVNGALRSTGPIATSESAFTRAAYTAMPFTLMNSLVWKGLPSKMNSNQYQDLIEQQQSH